MSTIYVPLTRDKIAVIDEEDAPCVLPHHWCAAKPHRVWYAVSRINGEYTYLHRFIMQAVPRSRIDHKNGDGLDCTRANLRFVTNQENAFNSVKRVDSQNPYKGIFRQGDRWRAYLRLNGKAIHLGIFDTAADAARAYDAKAIEIFGEYARTNRMLGLLLDDK